MIIADVVIGFVIATGILIVLFIAGNANNTMAGTLEHSIVSGNCFNAAIFCTGVPPSTFDGVIKNNDNINPLQSNAIHGSLMISTPVVNDNSDLTVNPGLLLSVFGDVVMNGGNTTKRKARIFFANNQQISVEQNRL